MNEALTSLTPERPGLVSDFEKMLTQTFEKEDIGVGIKTDEVSYTERMDGRYYGLVKEFTFPKFLENIPILRIFTKNIVKKVIEIRCKDDKIMASELEAGKWPDIKIKIKYDPDMTISARASEFIQRYRNTTGKTAELESIRTGY